MKPYLIRLFCAVIARRRSHRSNLISKPDCFAPLAMTAKACIAIVLFLGILVPCFAQSLWALTSSEAGQFEGANLAYRDGKFDEAASLYKALADQYPAQAVFSYNLGNALHRKGELGPAILAYERARQAAPRQEDILYNLAYARGLLEYRIDDKRNDFIKVGEEVLGFVKSEELEIAALLSVFLLFSAWAFALFFKLDLSWGLIRKTFFWLAAISLIFLGLKTVQESFFREAIVLGKDAQVYYGPSVNDQPAFKLGEGLKVYIRDERQAWSRVLIASGETGWIQNDQIASVHV